MKAYIVANFSNYINNRNDITYLITDCPIFTEEQYLFMKECLKDDIYSNITIKKLLTEKFNVNDFKLLLLLLVSSLFIFIVYVLVLPFSAVTFTLYVFVP